MKYEILTQNIKDFRKKANLTQKQLGEKIYKSEILIRKYESGKVNIPPSTLYDICTVLDVSSSTLLGSDFDSYHITNFGKTPEKGIDVDEIALPVSENYKKYGDSLRDAIFNIKSNPAYLLASILNYLETTEDYYSTLLVNLKGDKDASMSYLEPQQVTDIINKITDLVKYELYKASERK